MLSSEAMRRGALIALEGCDRAGKSTQIALLCERLESSGRPCVIRRFPDRGTATGKVIDAYLKSGQALDDRAIHLLFSANRWEAIRDIKALLDTGVTVLLDRYAYSGVAFSAAKGLDMNWCKGPDVGLPTPDLMFFLDLSPEEAEKRGGYGEERYEQAAFQALVRDKFLALREPHWHMVDARESIESMSQTLYQQALQVVDGPLGPLREDLFVQ